MPTIDFTTRGSRSLQTEIPRGSSGVSAKLYINGDMIYAFTDRSVSYLSTTPKLSWNYIYHSNGRAKPMLGGSSQDPYFVFGYSGKSVYYSTSEADINGIFIENGEVIHRILFEGGRDYKLLGQCHTRKNNTANFFVRDLTKNEDYVITFNGSDDFSMRLVQKTESRKPRSEVILSIVGDFIYEYTKGRAASDPDPYSRAYASIEDFIVGNETNEKEYPLIGKRSTNNRYRNGLYQCVEYPEHPRKPTLSISLDGKDWLSVDRKSEANFNNGRFMNGMYYAMPRGDEPRNIRQSTDGFIWTTSDIPLPFQDNVDTSIMGIMYYEGRYFVCGRNKFGPATKKLHFAAQNPSTHSWKNVDLIIQESIGYVEFNTVVIPDGIIIILINVAKIIMIPMDRTI